MLIRQSDQGSQQHPGTGSEIVRIGVFRGIVADAPITGHENHPPRLTIEVQHRYSPELRWASNTVSSILMTAYPNQKMGILLAGKAAAQGL